MAMCMATPRDGNVRFCGSTRVPLTNGLGYWTAKYSSWAAWFNDMPAANRQSLAVPLMERLLHEVAEKTRRSLRGQGIAAWFIDAFLKALAKRARSSAKANAASTDMREDDTRASFELRHPRRLGFAVFTVYPRPILAGTQSRLKPNHSRSKRIPHPAPFSFDLTTSDF